MALNDLQQTQNLSPNEFMIKIIHHNHKTPFSSPIYNVICTMSQAVFISENMKNVRFACNVSHKWNCIVLYGCNLMRFVIRRDIYYLCTMWMCQNPVGFVFVWLLLITRLVNVSWFHGKLIQVSRIIKPLQVQTCSLETWLFQWNTGLRLCYKRNFCKKSRKMDVRISRQCDSKL